MEFKELFKAELAVRGITGRKADVIVEMHEKYGLAALPLAASWDESEHPRAQDGKFTNGPDQNGSGDSSGSPSPKRDAKYPWRSKSSEKFGSGGIMSEEKISQFIKEIAPYQKKGEALLRSKPKYGRTPLEYLLMDLAKIEKGAGFTRYSSNGMFRPMNPDAFKKSLEILDDIHRLEVIESEEKLSRDKTSKYYHQKLAKELREIDDEIDRIEESYGDEMFGSLKFPKDEQGDVDRKRYRDLKRKRNSLERKIDWNLVDDDEEEG